MQKQAVGVEKRVEGGQAPLGPEKWGNTEATTIKRVVAVMSGKGGVGKSSLSGLIAVGLARLGLRTGIMDADVTGPSIPRMFGLTGRLGGSPAGLLPAASKELGIEVVSLNLLLEEEDAPVIWRGPLLAGAVKQFWQDVAWGNLDFLVVDLPPGTGDVPLTIMQSAPLDGLVVVSSPQELAVMVVRKAMKMAEMMDKPLIGLIENMSYLVCPHCGEEILLFGKSKAEETAKEFGLPFLGRLPVDPDLARLCDEGKIESYQGKIVEDLARALTERLPVPH